MLPGSWTSSSSEPGMPRAHAKLFCAIDPMSAQNTCRVSVQPGTRRRYNGWRALGRLAAKVQDANEEEQPPRAVRWLLPCAKGASAAVLVRAWVSMA